MAWRPAVEAWEQEELNPGARQFAGRDTHNGSGSEDDGDLVSPIMREESGRSFQGIEYSPRVELEALQLMATPLNERSPRFLRRMSSGTAQELSESLHHLDDDPERTFATFGQSVLNGVNVLAGVGVLSLPFAFRQTGWLLGSIFLVYLCLITNYTGKLIGRCMTMDKRIRSYSDLGSFAFGRRGKIFITFVFCVELCAALSMLVTIMGDNLAKLIEEDWATKELMYILSTCVVLPTCWTKKLELLSNLSIIGIVASFCLFLALIWTGITCETGNIDGGSFKDLHMDDFLAIASLAHFPYAIGLQMVGFAGHAVFPSIYDSLQDKSRFSRMIDIVYLACSTLYLAMGLVGYLLFTKHTQEELTLNLYDVAGNSVIVKFTIVLIIVNPMTKFALTLNPLATIVEETILEEEGVHVCKSIGIRTILTISALLLTIALPSFATICSFVGAFCSFVVSAIFPIMCYVRLFPLSPAWKAYNHVLLFVNSLLCVVGTVAVFFPPPKVRRCAAVLHV